MKVKAGLGEQTETVWLIDWENPEANHFAVAEEVTVLGQHTKRPDVVLYVNGIAVATIELKRSKVAVSEGIRQTIGNQKPEFIRPFFTTVQLVMAGNDVEGLRYAVIDTPEKYWLAWREPSDIDGPARPGARRSSARRSACSSSSTTSWSLTPASRRRAATTSTSASRRHRSGSRSARAGSSGTPKARASRLTMVWLAKWIREHQNDARVLLITDRTELDDQIEGVFNGVNESIYRTTSGADLLATLNKSTEWLICSLVHKFRGSDDDADSDEAEGDFIAELKPSPQGLPAPRATSSSSSTRRTARSRARCTTR